MLNNKDFKFKKKRVTYDRIPKVTKATIKYSNVFRDNTDRASEVSVFSWHVLKGGEVSGKLHRRGDP